MPKRMQIMLILATVGAVALAPTGAWAQELDWTVQFSAPPRDATVDPAGHTLMASTTLQASDRQAIVRALDPDGQTAWTDTFGSLDDDRSWGVGTDEDGRLFAAGDTAGTLPGQASAGETDAWVRAYDPDGSVLWTRQFGTSSHDAAHDVAVGSGGETVVVGRTDGDLAGIGAGGTDAFARKYDAQGTPVWTRQFGGAGTDWAFGVAIGEGGSAYVTGHSDGTTFLVKYDAAGNQLWRRDFGPPTSLRPRVATDGVNGVFVAFAASSGTDFDFFLWKFDASGSAQWSRTIETQWFERDVGVAADPLGNSYVTGMTALTVGQTNFGGDDAFVRKYDPSGGVDWTLQVGTSAFDKSLGIGVDALGNAYIAGETSGTFAGPGTGGGYAARITSTGDEDGDGTPDAADPDTLAQTVAGLPSGAFAPDSSASGRRTALLAQIDQVQSQIAAGNTAQAIGMLEALRMKVDGCDGTASEVADANDVIVDCVEQRAVRAIIDLLLAALRMDG